MLQRLYNEEGGSEDLFAELKTLKDARKQHETKVIVVLAAARGSNPLDDKHDPSSILTFKHDEAEDQVENKMRLSLSGAAEESEQ